MTKFWKKYQSWEEAEKEWDAKARALKDTHPLKTPAHQPRTPDITQGTRNNLKLKTLKYLLSHDTEGLFRKHVFKRPLKYAYRYLKSALKKKRYTRDGDLYFFGVPDAETFRARIAAPDALLVVGFSFCQKPLECPEKRFSAACRHDPHHPVCRQCLIGKVLNSLPDEKPLSVIIPTIYDIGRTLFETLEQHPQKKIYFLTTACALSLEMFADFGHMINIQGVGIRLSGRVCNTLRAFTLAENGIKPGLTLLTQATQEELFRLIKM